MSFKLTIPSPQVKNYAYERIQNVLICYRCVKGIKHHNGALLPNPQSMNNVAATSPGVYKIGNNS